MNITNKIKETEPDKTKYYLKYKKYCTNICTKIS